MTRIVGPEEARAFWEARYAQAPLYGTEPTSVARRLLEVFRRQKVRTILEAGCGSGRDVLLYAREGFAVTALDLSANALGWIRGRADAEGLRIILLQGDLTDVKLPAGAFDASVAIHLIHLQPAPVRQAMVNRLWQLTCDGGLVAMANYSTGEAGFSIWDLYPERNTRVDPKGKLVHFFDAEDLRSLLPPDRFDLLTLEEVDLAEVPDGGPVVHREWLTVARKIRTC